MILVSKVCLTLSEGNTLQTQVKTIHLVSAYDLTGLDVIWHKGRIFCQEVYYTVTVYMNEDV